MELIDKRYPYPVLTAGNDDYVGCSFDVEVQLVKHDVQLELPLNAKLGSNSLQALIEDGYATIIMHIECSRSAYRRSHEIPLGEHTITIPSGDVSGSISLCPFIVARKDIENYKSEEFNPIYQDFVFRIRAGAVLAEGIEKSVFVDTSTRDIDYKPDIFSLVPDKAMDEDNEQKSLIKIDPFNSKISIRLPTKAFSQYGALLKSGISSEVVHCVVILPAMMEALACMREAYRSDALGDIKDFVWFNAVRERIMQLYPLAKQDMKGFLCGEMNIATVAQSLIKSPVVDALNMLANSSSVAGGSDEN